MGLTVLVRGHRRLLGAFALALVAPWAQAQGSTHLVNADTGNVLAKGRWELGLDGRFFGEKESNGYGGFRGYYGLGDGFDVTLKGSFGGRKTFNGNGFGIRYGGYDFEGQIRYGFRDVPGLTISAGASFPDTPAQKKGFFTAGVNYRLPIQSAGIYLGLRGLYRDKASLTALTLGAEYAFTPEWSLMGDVAAVVDGQNSVSSSTGRAQRTATFGLGVRYTPMGSPNMSYLLGVTNAIGGTTGFGLTPSFGGTTGLFVGLNFKG